VTTTTDAFLQDLGTRSMDRALSEARREIRRQEKLLARCHERRQREVESLRDRVAHLEAALRAACERNRILATRAGE
jgi:DNA-binding winged helix-turn-helix (wHTH) protein